MFQSLYHSGGAFATADPGYTTLEVNKMITENELLDHIYQTAEMGSVGLRAVLRRADEP